MVYVFFTWLLLFQHRIACSNTIFIIIIIFVSTSFQSLQNCLSLQWFCVKMKAKNFKPKQQLQRTARKVWTQKELNQNNIYWLLLLIVYSPKDSPAANSKCNLPCCGMNLLERQTFYCLSVRIYFNCINICSLSSNSHNLSYI